MSPNHNMGLDGILILCSLSGWTEIDVWKDGYHKVFLCVFFSATCIWFLMKSQQVITTKPYYVSSYWLSTSGVAALYFAKILGLW